MSEPTCQIVIMELMATGDGRPPSVPIEVINAHLASCAACREEARELEGLGGLLDAQRRQIPSDDLWPMIAPRLKSKKAAAGEKTTLYYFILFGASLALYKLLELIPERRIDVAFKLIPIIIAVSLFAFLKENPFKINPRLGADTE
ncbi:MAG TPA: hypothetical protein VE262_17585 [Blastocatellia bacterium]|nr:hypothetical protein [Blastocatellia bacterium]